MDDNTPHASETSDTEPNDGSVAADDEEGDSRGQNVTYNRSDRNSDAESPTDHPNVDVGIGDDDPDVNIGDDDPDVNTDLGSGGRDRSATDVDLDGVVLDDEEENKGLFDDLLSGEPIFENKEVLRPSYTPHELPHRNDQINQMATILVSALRGETPSNILIYGKTGPEKPPQRSSSHRNSSRRPRSTTSRVKSST